ncbi:MAG: BlaI/MecI/CopY family transcriptional regulator [Planctomycetota bacterium]|jgi:predicted transcriptional regulator
MAEAMPTLGEMEMRVLRLVWQLQPCTERQVSDLIIAERDVARTTVLKTLQRLEAKQLLERVPDSSPVQFRALVEQQRVLPTLIGRFINDVLGGSPDPLVAYFSGSGKLSSKDLTALREIARKLGEPTHE